MKRRMISAIVAVLAVCMLCGCSQSAAQPAEAQQHSQDTQAAAPKAEALLTDIEVVTNIKTTQYFTDQAVKESDIETIVQAGVNAPSAMNKQPWHLTVITDTAVLQRIADDMGGGMGFGGGMPPAGKEFPEDMKMPEGMDFPENAEMPEGMPEGFTSPEDFTPPAGDDQKTPPAEPSGGSGGMSKAGLADAPMAIVVSCTKGSELDAGLACQNMSVAAQLLGYGTKIISSPTMALNGANQAEYRELLGIPENQSAAAILLIGMEDTTVDQSVDGYTGATTRNPIEETVTYLETK